jgi:hypothetical protein
MSKYYFIPLHPDTCYNMAGVKHFMKQHGITEIQVEKARQSFGTGMFWCTYYQEMGETGNCDSTCPAYKPRNGIKGRCKNHSIPFENTGEKLTVRLTEKDTKK